MGYIVKVPQIPMEAEFTLSYIDAGSRWSWEATIRQAATREGVEQVRMPGEPKGSREDAILHAENTLAARLRAIQTERDLARAAARG